MNRSPYLSIALALFITFLMTGCMTYSEGTRIIAMEAEKVAKIELGMSIAEVQKIMGTDMINFGGDMEARPIRRDRFLANNGDPIEVFYYRSSHKKADGFCTDDETTAVIFVKDKVDAITSGDTSKTVIEIRRR